MIKRYDKYKESGVDWIGNVPEHWDIKSLRNFLRLVSVKGHGDKQLLSVTREYGIIIRDTKSKEENHNFIPDDLSGYKLVQKGQFVINKMKSWQGSYGVSQFTGIVSPAYYVCDLNFENKDFFSRAIRSCAYVPFFSQLSKGIRVDQWDLSTNALKNIPFIVPPLYEQQYIVDYLDKKCSQIDLFISKKEKEVELLKEWFQSEIDRVVTKGVNPGVKLKDSGISWIGQIPEHWDLKRLAIMFYENKNKNDHYEFTHAMKFNYGELVPKGEIGDVSDLKDTYLAYTIINENDIAINCLNLNYDFVSQRVAISHQKGIITSAYLIISPRENVNAHYYNYLFKSMDSRKLFHGMGTGIRLTLSFAELKKQTIPVAPYAEQQSIVNYINGKRQKVEQMISSILSEISHLKDYRQSLISDVITGKIKVTP